MQSANATGPLGFPQTDEQARWTEEMLRYKAGEYQQIRIEGKAVEVSNKRTDVSWISTETPDRYNHIMIAAGMNAEAYQLNPIVTDQHDYTKPPIGRSNWQRISSRKGVAGVMAETHYPERPDGLTGDWPPDLIFAQIVAGLLNAKSIGFLPLKIREPQADGEPLVIQKWALLEYAVGTLPVNPDTTIIAIQKHLPKPIDPIAVAIEIRKALDLVDAGQLVDQVVRKLRGEI